MPTAERPSLTVDVALTPKAAEQVRHFLRAEDATPETAGLRVAVMPGGCSGFKYDLRIDDQPLDDDIIVESEGLKLFVDWFSAQYLQGTRIDFASTMTESGFTFNNPNATGGCGCGSSFSA